MAGALRRVKTRGISAATRRTAALLGARRRRAARRPPWVSDVGIYGLLGRKLATYALHHEQGLAYTLYLLTFALDSVGDVFGSVFLISAGLLVLQSRIPPRWLAWIAVTAGILLFLQGFGLGGVIGTYGLVLDLIGFVLFLLFVLISSAILLRDRGPAARSA